jgi:iron complex outermembrane receptor protein
MKNIRNILFALILLFGAQLTQAQTEQKKVAEMTKEEMMELTYDDLLQMSFEDLILASNKFGMSSDELLDFFLNKDVTSASKRAEKSLNSPLSTTVISKEEILNSGATSIPDALRLVPGMIVREKTPGNYDVHIRGNDNLPTKNMFLYSEDAMSLVMIDSRPVYNYSFGGTFWESLPIDLGDVERIEVIRGPSSALYGPNAVSGAINIITKKPEGKKLAVNANAEAGTNSSKKANLGISGGVGKFKFRASGNYTHFDRFENDFYIFDLNQKYKKEQIDTMTTYWLSSRVKLPINPIGPDSTNRFPDPWLGTDKYGVNGFVFYDLNKDVNVALSFGLQDSKIISSSLGNGDHPLAGRISNSKYVDLRSNFYGFQLQANQMWGDQEIQKGSLGWYISPTIRNASLEYEKTFLGTLTLRPGVSYQQAIYSDQEHLTAQETADRKGFLNGTPELNAFAGYLRADYKLFDKLRLIAAIRADKYNVPDKTYFTYQFISSYDINKSNVVRAVYSRANRGPFIVDSYANYDWQIVAPSDAAKAPSTMYPYTLYWRGNKNLKMPVMDMFELGYRTQPTKNIMIDIEAFRTVTKDYNYFLPDSFNANVNFGRSTVGLSPVITASGNVRYYNFDLKTIQSGITANVSVVINKELQFKVFATMQQTKLEGLYDKTLWQCFDEMSQPIKDDGTILTIAGYAKTAQLAGEAGALLQAGQTPSSDQLQALTAYQANPSLYNDAVTAYSNFTPVQLQTLATIVSNGYQKVYSASNQDLVNGKINPASLVNETHKATPTFYGGVTVDYSPEILPKLHVSSTMYWYTENALEQTKINDIGRYTLAGVDKTKTPGAYNPDDYSSVYTVEPKFILNLKVSYKVWKDCSVFVNTRNLLNSSKREFGYLDEIKGLYMLGMNLNF